MVAPRHACRRQAENSRLARERVEQARVIQAQRDGAGGVLSPLQQLQARLIEVRQAVQSYRQLQVKPSLTAPERQEVDEAISKLKLREHQVILDLGQLQQQARGLLNARVEVGGR
eukprot:753977-Pleurochrysis_carterae.AAC.1